MENNCGRRAAGLCWMSTCRGERFELVHRLPLSKSRRQAWLQVINLPRMERLNYVTICSRHFRPEDYVHDESNQLNRVAVPNINLRDLSELHLCRKVRRQRVQKITAVEDMLKKHSENASKRQRLSCEEPATSISEATEQEEEEEEEAFLLFEVESNEEQKCMPALSETQSEDTTVAVIEEAYSEGQQSDIMLEHERELEHDLEHQVEEQNEYLSVDELEKSLLGRPQNIIEVVNEKWNDDEEFEPIEKMKDCCDNINSDVDDDTNNNNNNNSNYNKKTKNIAESVDRTMSDVLFIIEITNCNILLRSPQNAETLLLDFVCLRDSCQCDICYDARTGTRLSDDDGLINCSLEPLMTTIKKGKLIVKWSDNHMSRYSIRELFRSMPTQHSKAQQLIRKPHSWCSQSLNCSNDDNDIVAIRYNDLICNDSKLEKAVISLQRSGILLVSEVCTVTEQRTPMLELLLRRMFPHNNSLWIKEQRKFQTSKCKKLPHTNCTFLSESCGLQLLSMNMNSSCCTTSDSVELTLLDGLTIAQKLRQQSAETFQYFSQQTIPLHYRSAENFDYNIKAKVIELCVGSTDDVIERIRYAPYQRAANKMSRPSLEEYNRHLRILRSIVADEPLQWNLQLKPDMLIILDNWRILWQPNVVPSAEVGRDDGACLLDCMYVERKQFLSRLNSIKCNTK